MNAILSGILQVILASGILYAYYHFVLRNRRFHRYNRFYLLAAVLISVLVPLLNIPYYFSPEEADHSVILRALTVFQPSADKNVTVYAGRTPTSWHISFTEILYAVYLFIALVLFTRILLSLQSIRRLIRTYPAERMDDISFVNTDASGTPFSFFRWLFWNREIALDSPSGRQVFRHEIFHIREKHSLDIIFLELITTIGWINPFFHLIKKETKAIHEFLADEYAVQQTDSLAYAELLLMQVLQTRQKLVNPFFHNQIKRRIAMITKSSKTSYQYLRKILVLPLAVLITALFAFTYKMKQPGSQPPRLNSLRYNTDTSIIPGTLNSSLLGIYGIELKYGSLRFGGNNSNGPASLEQPPILIINSNAYEAYAYKNKTITADSVVIYHAGDPEAIRLYGDAALKTIFVLFNARVSNTKSAPAQNLTDETENLIFTKVEIEPMFPGGKSQWLRFLMENLNANVPVDKHAPPGQYSVVMQFIVHTDGRLSDFKPLTHFGYGMEEEVLRIFKRSPKWLPAVQNGKQVTAYMKQTVTFVTETDDDTLPAKPAKKDSDKPVLIRDKSSQIPTNKDDASIPRFPGGTDKWIAYIVKDCKMNVPVDSGAPAGLYKASVNFLVKKDGTISNIKAITQTGYGTEKELIRLISQGPKWVPASSNGKNVEATAQQSLTFVVEEDPVKKENPSGLN